MATDPNRRWRNTKAWLAINASVRAALDENGLASDNPTIESIVGAVCARLDADELLTGTRLASVRAVVASHLGNQAWLLNSIALEICAMLDNQYDDASVRNYLEAQELIDSHEIDGLTLARQAREAYDSAS